MGRDHPHRDTQSIASAAHQPLVGVVSEDDGQRVTRYFVDDQAAADATLAAARAVIGAWEGLEPWDEVVEELDRIRHESVPTPPIEL